MNKIPDLNVLAAFAAVARHQSFRKAAEERGVSASALSHTVRGLEEQMNQRLLNRTTRSVTLTAAGEQLFAQIVPSIAAIHQAVNDLENSGRAVYGTLRLNMPHSAAQLLIAPILSDYHRLYPAVRLEIIADDRLTDIVRQGCDAGIRFGQSLQPEMIAVAVGNAQQFSVVASADYLRRYGEPEVPEALLSHRCIGRVFPSGKCYQWEFLRDGRVFTVAVPGHLALSHESMIRSQVLEGNGIAYVYRSLIEDEINSGTLQEILTAWLPPPEQFYLYYYGRRQVPAALKKLIELLRA
ncbi:LysR family transcriptional regulator [Enterobacteriaceae bacterium RIT693]|nr:LysR family transcriptional regulator [Enterobacteriaceae bacterium RIT693]